MNTKHLVKEIVKPVLDYELVLPFSDGLAYVRKNFKDSKIGFIDKTGNIVIPIELDDGKNSREQDTPYIFSEGLSGIYKNGKCGFIDKTGKIVVPFKYDSVYLFSEGLAAVKKTGKWGFIDKTGETVIPFEYDWVLGFHEGLAASQKDGKLGFIDKTGTATIPFELEYDFIDSFNEGLARVKIGKEPEFTIADSPEEIRNKIAAARAASKFGYIDKTGKIIVPVEYNGTHGFRDGLANMYKEGSTNIYEDGQWSYVNETGKTVMEAKYEHAERFSENLAWVKKNEKWGCIDKTGKVAIPMEYDDYDHGACFINGFSTAIKGGNIQTGKWGIIDKNNRVVVPFEYERLHYSENLVVVKKDGKWGILEIYK